MEYFQKHLFHNITYQEYESMRVCLAAKELSFTSGDTISRFGEDKKYVGVLASGSASTVRYELNGSRTILERLGPQDIFGEVLSFQNTRHESVSVICDKSCRVLFFDYEHILSPCSKVCSCHQQLIQNMLQIISDKAILLGERVEVLSKRSIREKLTCYFFHLAEKAGSAEITIPFTMVDLADYLSVDRSAMTRELKKMKEEGNISMERRKVVLLSTDGLLASLSR